MKVGDRVRVRLGYGYHTWDPISFKRGTGNETGIVEAVEGRTVYVRLDRPDRKYSAVVKASADSLEMSNPYSPKTGAKCSCRPGVQRDNCPQCEGTGWVIDFKKIHERRKENPARWAHGVMSYRQPPGSVIPMKNNPRRRRRSRRLAGQPRRRRVKSQSFAFANVGGQFYLNTRRRGRRNPSRGGGGGTNWLLIGGLAVGAFFLLPKLASAGGIFGSGAPAGVPAGYTPIGNGLYRAPNGAVVARNPQTGQMVAAPAGSQPTSAEDLLTRAGISMIPAVANNLASWISSMFTTQQTATGAIPGSWGAPGGAAQAGGGAMPEGGSIFGDLPPLPSGGGDLWAGWGSGGGMSQEEYEWTVGSGEGLPPLNELPTYPVYDWGTDWGSYEYGGYEAPGLPPLDYDVMIGVGSGDVVIANPDEWYGFFGLGRAHRGGHRRPYMGLRATPPVY